MPGIEIAPYAPLLVYKNGYTAEFVEQTIRKRKLDGLRIFAQLREQRLPDLDFLRDYTFLKVLDICSIDDHDLDFLPRLSGLQELGIDLPGKKVIDVSHLTDLERLSISWRPVSGLDKLNKLNRLFISEYKAADLAAFATLHSLRELAIKTANLKSLNGVQELKNLENLVLGNCGRLVSISALNGLEKLKTLELDICRKIEDYEEALQCKNRK